VLYTAGGVGSIIGAVLVGVLGDRWRKGPLLLGATFGFGLLLVGLSRSTVLAVSLTLLTGMGLANAVGGTMTSTIMVTTAPPELRGRVMSVNILVFGLSPFGSLLLGALADLLDVPAALTISGLALLTVITLTAATRPRLRGL
jgi:MFS family permease